MSFADQLVIYFTRVLDATTFIQFFMFSLYLVVLTFPKQVNKRNILFGAVRFLVIYAIYISFESLCFATAAMIGQMVAGMIFTASFAIIPIFYLVIFVKDKPLHKTIKIAVTVASLLIISEIGRSFGLFMGDLTHDTTILVIIARSFPMLFLPLIAYILYKFNISRFANLPKIHVLMLLALALLLSSSAVWQVFLQINNYGIRWLLIFISVVELLVLVGIYYSIYHLIDYRHRITELEVASSVLAIEKEALEIDIKNREELMKIRHDLRNQLSYTNVLLNEGKFDDAKNYIASLIEQKEEYIYSFSCSNLVISGIVNLELTKAKLQKIKVKFKVVVPPKLPFEDSDLLSLITNIVDNSYENFVPKDENDEVMITILTQQDYLRITSFNTVDKNNVSNKLSLKTSKEGRTHGYGTKIIKNVARKYDGYVSFNYENDKFVCDCLLNMNHKGVKNA